MLAGEKFVAKFTDFIPAGFVPHLASGRFVCETVFYAADDMDFAYPAFVIYVPEYEAQARRLMALLTPELLRYDETHREIGQILGYEAWQIEAFLQYSKPAEGEDVDLA